MKNSLYLPLIFATIALVADANAQACITWNDSPKKDEAETAHTLYRDAIKSGKILDAIPNWEKAFNIAPAADGLRDWHYTDGILIYKTIFEKETDAAKKEAAVNKIHELYARMINCYNAKVIKIAGCNSDDCTKQKISDIKAQEAYDMYYTLRAPYKDLLKVLDESAALGGKNSLYTIITPYADVAVYQFLNKELSKEATRDIYNKVNEIGEFNIANNKKYNAYYKDALAYANAKFGEVEDYIFDCEYFKEKLTPEYKKDAENHEVIKTVYNKLSSKGCGEDDPLMIELKTKYEKITSEENARRKAEFEANNPIYVAQKLMEGGDFTGAIEKYREAVDSAQTNSEKGEMLLNIASIQYRKLGQAASARETARRAASLKPNWGAPYLLIGDMYVGGANNCGDSWITSLAILAAIDKYQYAKATDPSMTDDANSRIGRISAYMPEKEQGFMQNKKEGDSLNVPCWIGETVRLRYKS